jgi:hypothetical protein
MRHHIDLRSRHRLSSARAAAAPQPPLLYAVATIHSCAVATIHSCTVATVHSRAAVVLATATAPFIVPSAGSSCCSIQHVMGRDKRKGKEPVVEPLKKKNTRTQKEAERAAMAARAADDHAARHGHRF